MKLENQVVSLEIAKRLKELGVKQESLFWHVDNNGYDSEIILEEYLIPKKGWFTRKTKGGISAFTVAELGEMLPNSIVKDKEIYYFGYANGCGKNYPNYTCYRNGIGYLMTGYPLLTAGTEADARGKMLIYLLENNLTK